MAACWAANVSAWKKILKYASNMFLPLLIGKCDVCSLCPNRKDATWILYWVLEFRGLVRRKMATKDPRSPPFLISQCVTVQTQKEAVKKELPADACTKKHLTQDARHLASPPKRIRLRWLNNQPRVYQSFVLMTEAVLATSDPSESWTGLQGADL